ncbi:diacylglycerol kinase family protein [Microbacterium sp. MPKO10]|uniref:diacylglycerol/lipid kinase family protein n=1 Tax=Microbacterium sp. MPKO10 TaxID=2989818 RepID=UPI00223606D0|nr:diacylglycerol kinase family protein [Microbacterium sp. MPKO10]MCW4459299.1 diacylglycerol kinase family protein [Microbacterium sp. MPKO10]
MSREPYRIAVAINPASSFGAHSAVGMSLVDALARQNVEVTTLIEADAEKLGAATAAAVRSNPDALVAVGGDGLVNVAINALADSEVPLAIVPTGTGNDFARGLGIARDKPDAAAQRILTALRADSIRVVDVGVARTAAGERRFGGVVSVGFDARVNARANAMRWPRGGSRYVLAVLRELASFRAEQFTVTLGSHTSTHDAPFISIANNRFIGGGMAIAPDADLDDGLLDVVRVDPISKLALLAFFPRVFAGTHTRLEIVHVQRVREISLAGASVDAYADGENLGTLPVSIRVIPHALRVIV